MEQDTSPEIVELINEFGEPERFEHVMTLEYQENPYLVMHPQDADDEGAVVVFRIVTDDAGEETYEVVEDEELSNAVFSEFLMILEAGEEEQ